MIDYDKFAIDMQNIIKEFVPDNFSDEEKTLLCCNLCNSYIKSFLGLKQAKLNEEQKNFIALNIAKYTYLKIIDMIKEQVDEKYRQTIIEGIGFILYEVITRCIEQHQTENEITKKIENMIDRIYLNSKNYAIEHMNYCSKNK